MYRLQATNYFGKVCENPQKIPKQLFSVKINCIEKLDNKRFLLSLGCFSFNISTPKLYVWWLI